MGSVQTIQSVLKDRQADPVRQIHPANEQYMHFLQIMVQLLQPAHIQPSQSCTVLLPGLFFLHISRTTTTHPRNPHFAHHFPVPVLVFLNYVSCISPRRGLEWQFNIFTMLSVNHDNMAESQPAWYDTPQLPLRNTATTVSTCLLHAQARR